MKAVVPEIKIEEGDGTICNGVFFISSVLSSWHRMPGFTKKESAEDVVAIMENAYERGWNDREREFMKQFNLDQH